MVHALRHCVRKYTAPGLLFQTPLLLFPVFSTYLTQTGAISFKNDVLCDKIPRSLMFCSWTDHKIPIVHPMSIQKRKRGSVTPSRMFYKNTDWITSPIAARTAASNINLTIYLTAFTILVFLVVRR